MALVEIFAAAALVQMSPAPPPHRSEEAAALATLNEQVLRTYALERDVSGYRAHAHPRYTFIYAPGIIENLDVVISGVDQVNLERFDMQTLWVDIVGDSAIILSRVDARGSVAGHPFPDRMAMAHHWVRQDGSWKLLGETMTPILVPDEEFERMRRESLGER
jgi:hypothetical protein